MNQELKKNFGYHISRDRQLDYDAMNREAYQKVAQAEPTVKACISCGTCSATCSTGGFTNFSLHRYILLLKRGYTGEVKDKIGECMLCGKCQLACPMGVNTRNLILTMQKILHTNE